MILAIYTALGVEVAADDGERRESKSSLGGALESLVCLVEEAVAGVGQRLSGVSALAVCTGPGSFTGLRIGVAFAKSFAQARDLPITGISSYDVAAFGLPSGPLCAVARGKSGYYYARLSGGPDAVPQFIQGTRETIEQAVRRFSPHARVVGPDFTEQRSGEAALAVASLARQAFERAPGASWVDVAIDYGQRPNAEINWERRRGEAPRGAF